MAESMTAHFTTATYGEVSRWLDYRAAGSDGHWAFPASDYLVLVYEYADHRSEFEPEELERLCKLLGGFPASGLCLELRRSKGRSAHDAAAALATDLLREFPGAVQDINGEVYWSLADLEAGAADRAAAEWWSDAEPAAAPDGRA